MDFSEFLLNTDNSKVAVSIILKMSSMNLKVGHAYGDALKRLFKFIIEV